MEMVYHDGGRANAGYRGQAGDCVTRAIAIATGMDYQTVYDQINELAKKERTGKHNRRISSARNGVYASTSRKYLQSLGWEWVPTMHIGSGCTVHLSADELPKGTIIVKVSRHLTVMKDGVIYDTHDPSRDGGRCVYGYYRKVIGETNNG